MQFWKKIFAVGLIVVAVVLGVCFESWLDSQPKDIKVLECYSDSIGLEEEEYQMMIIMENGIGQQLYCKAHME